MTLTATTTVQINRMTIKATPQAIWDAITKPEWIEKYGYGGRAQFDLRPGGRFRSMADAAMRQAGMPECVVDGEVVESDPPNRLVQTCVQHGPMIRRPGSPTTSPQRQTGSLSDDHPRPRRRTGHRSDGRRLGRRCRWRLGRGDQRPEDPAGDGSSLSSLGVPGS
jgi:uncharacterized protein YndB with AHSA1/START domain